jgi:palmitoyltransferase
MGNDRFKMSFWFEALFDDDLNNDAIHELPPDDLDVKKVHEEVKNWLKRNAQREKLATELLERYVADVQLGPSAGPLPEELDIVESESKVFESTAPVWKPDLQDKYEQDRLYSRVSHEIDVWWKRVRDANYEGWVVPMESVEGAIARATSCKENAMHRYMPRGQDLDHDYTQEEHEHYGDRSEDATNGEDDVDERSIREDNGEEGDLDEEEDEDDSYVEGPLRGLLTEIPNILDTKQIEALHMTVKACIVDSMGSGLTPAGENLQKTRCKMFLALDCGKNLLREMLVFIAVWEQTDQQFIFQITAQIIESFHHNALLPYAWNSLRILKDIVSPAQTVLLRLINYMFRARKDSPIYDDLRDYNRDAKLIHFLYNYFRCRVVPDCIALIYAQAQIRQAKSHPSDFPVDLWDMERAKDGLSQYLDFISVIAEIPEMRPLLIEWEAVYELIALLKALEDGVERKPIDARPMPSTDRRPNAQGSGSGSSTPVVERPYDENDPHAGQPEARPQTSVMPLHDEPHKFPWAGIKIQILIILTSLVSPYNQRRNGPGNPIVQKQLLEREGIMPLLNCCVYDGHNEYLKERATLAIKFVMEGCEEAQKFVRELVPIKQTQIQAQSASQGSILNSDKQQLGTVPPAPKAAIVASKAGPNAEVLKGKGKEDDNKQADLLDGAARLAAVAQSIKDNTDEYTRVMAREQKFESTVNHGDGL